jgi:hypothetical protein
MGGQVFPVVDVRREENHTADATPGPLEAQKKVSLVLVTDRQSHQFNPPTGLILPYTRPPLALPQTEETTSVVRPLTLLSSASESNDQIQPRESPQIVQSTDEPSVIRIGLAQPESPVMGPVWELRVTDEAAVPVPMKRGLRQGSVPTQGCDLTKGANEEDDASRNEDTQVPFSDNSWEGWGLIQTPNGDYLPETFKPFPSGFEDLTNQW